MSDAPAPRPAAARPAPKKPNALLEIGVTIVLPSLVLMRGTEILGPVGALVLALAFPLGWAVWDGLRRRKLNWLAAIGIASTLMTGGIGLMQLDTHWYAIKEGAVPAAIGLVVAVSAWTRRPLIHALVFDASLLDTARVERELAARGNEAEFALRLRQATLGLASTFAFSAVMNYGLARWIVTSPTGTPEFNAELGRMTLLSYPLIALPSMVMMGLLIWWLSRIVHRLTGCTFTELLAQPT